MATTEEPECPHCHQTDFMMASLSDDIAASLDDGSGVVFVSCNACGDRLAITVEPDHSRNPATDATAEGATCPECAAANILAVELPGDALIQLEDGYLMLDVSCMDCDTAYTVQADVVSITNE